MREHLPTGKMASGFAYSADRLLCPIIRV